MEIDEILLKVPEFSKRISNIKTSIENVRWYLYDSFGNFELMHRGFKGPGRAAFAGIDSGLRIADIGAADGDTSFFFESLGAHVTIIDNGSTNANGCRAIREVGAVLDSKVKLIDTDLDWTLKLDGEYDLVVFLGILYHLRNPLLALNTVAFVSEHLLLSTKVFSNYQGQDISKANLAYVFACREINNDPTNYWMFTPESLRVCLKRSGWMILDEFVVSDTAQGNQRMFCYCKRVPNWRDLRSHHDF